MTAVFRNSTEASAGAPPTVHLARNEFEALQLVVTADAAVDAARLSVVPQTLSNEQGGGGSPPTVVLSPIGYVHAGPCPYPTPAGVTCPHDSPLWCGNLSATGRPGCGGAPEQLLPPASSASQLACERLPAQRLARAAGVRAALVRTPGD